MENIERSLSEKIADIIRDYNFKNPKVDITEAVRGGYLGVPSKITIEGEKDGEIETLHLYLKAAPKSPTREKGPFREAFLSEILMYTEILPAFLQLQKEKAVSAPFNSIVKCFGTSTVEEEEFLIFEDLTYAGYTLCDKTKPMTTEVVEFVLKETARYHAMSFAFRDQKPEVYKSFVSKLGEEIMVQFCREPAYLAFLAHGLDIALRCFDPVEERHIYKKLDDFAKNEAEQLLLNFPVDEEDIIIHGDSWCNNFMFVSDDPLEPKNIEKMVFLDWQCSRLSSPVLDLCYFFYCNGPLLAFDNFDYYLKIYHGTLSLAIRELGSDPEYLFPFSTLKVHWKKYAKFGIIMVCLLMMHIYGHSEIEDVLGTVAKGKSVTEVYDRDTLARNIKYRERIRATIIHFVKNGLI